MSRDTTSNASFHGDVRIVKPFSFIHAADLHLGFSQYGLEARREDFESAFRELVDKAVELKPDFMIIAGDLFHHARPSNIVLESTVKDFSRLRDAGIPVLTVDGSHDSAPNVVTGTILNPLDGAGLICHLPRHEGACWTKSDCCYVYGVPNYRTRQRTEEFLPVFIEQHVPKPDHSRFNIFVLHMAIDLPGVKPPYIEAEVRPELIPDGFDYYAAGHVHKTYMDKFKTGVLVYSGSLETVNYEEAQNKKGFYYVKVDEKGEASSEFFQLESPRKFIVLELEFTGLVPSKITERTVQLVKDADKEGVIIVPVIKGLLPIGANRSEVNTAEIRNSAEKALLVHPVVLLHESQVSEEIVRSIFESEFKDLKTKAFEYFVQIFVERYGREEAEKIAGAAMTLVEPLTKRQEEKVKEMIEELVH